MKEADYRLEEVKKRRRENRKARRLMIALIFGFLLFGVALGVYQNPWQLLPLGVMLGLLVLVTRQIVGHIDQSLAREQETGDKWRSQQMAGADEP